MSDARDLVPLEPSALLLPEDLERMRVALVATKSARTRQAYQWAWASWTTWARGRNLDPEQLTAETVGAFLLEQLESGRWNLRSVSVARAGLTWVARRTDQAAPFYHSPLFRDLLDGARRMYAAPPKRARAVTPDDVRALLEVIEPGSWLRSALLVGLITGMRSAELLAVRRVDLERKDLGFEVTIPRSKTDQRGFGRVCIVPSSPRPDLCAVRALEERLEAIEEAPGARVWPYSGQGLRKACAAACKRAGIVPTSPHGMRAGFDTIAVESGARLDRIREQTGQSYATISEYVRVADRWKDSAAARVVAQLVLA